MAQPKALKLIRTDGGKDPLPSRSRMNQSFLKVQKDVKGSCPDTEHVRFRTLPEVTVSCATRKGSYAQMGGIHEAVAALVSDNGYVFDGLMFNICHVIPWTRRPGCGVPGFLQQRKSRNLSPCRCMIGRKGRREA